MKQTSCLFFVLVLIAVTVHFRVEGLPRPQDDPSFTFVDGFAFDGDADRQIPPRSTTARIPDIARTVRPNVVTNFPNTVTSTTQAPDVAQCTQNCRFQVTSEYNPVCGTDQVVYTNPGMLSCVSMCGLNVSHAHFGPCVTNLRG